MPFASRNMPLGSFYGSVRGCASFDLRTAILLATTDKGSLGKLEIGLGSDVDLYRLTIKSIGGL